MKTLSYLIISLTAVSAMAASPISTNVISAELYEGPGTLIERATVQVCGFNAWERVSIFEAKAVQRTRSDWQGCIYYRVIGQPNQPIHLTLQSRSHGRLVVQVR